MCNHPTVPTEVKLIAHMTLFCVLLKLEPTRQSLDWIIPVVGTNRNIHRLGPIHMHPAPKQSRIVLFGRG